MWTAFHILCPFLSWFVHIYSNWFVWALCVFVKIFFVFLKEGNYLFSVVWIANIMYILSFISWLHGICFHKSILILMWLNSFIFCFMETSMMGGKTQCWDYPLPCPAGPLWSQRVGVDRGWNRVDGMCVSCVSIGCECWGGCWVSHSHRPRTTLPSHVTFAKKTAHGTDLYPHREVSFWGLITFSTIWPRWHHYTPSSELDNLIILTSRRVSWNFLFLSSWGSTVFLTIWVQIVQPSHPGETEALSY